MTEIAAPAEQTTAFALHEKAKLQKSLSGFDMVFFTLCAFVGLDTLGLVAAAGPQGFSWLLLLAVLFVFPYALVLAELGSTFTEEGGPYEWVKMSFGRFQGAIAAVLYWVTNPLWVGGSLAFIACEAWAATDLPALGINDLGSVGDFVFKGSSPGSRSSSRSRRCGAVSGFRPQAGSRGSSCWASSLSHSSSTRSERPRGFCGW